ncbi:MAG: NAD-binding protein, partial [Anaerolineae bacterium]
TDALKLEIPDELTIVGAGATGLEFAVIYKALGCKKVNVVEMREQVFLPLTSLLVKRSLTQSDLQRIVGSLKYIKYVPEAACAALDLWPGEIDAVALLAAQFPQINIALVAEVEAFRTGSNPTADPQKVQQMLQQSLRFVEQLNETLWNKA